MGYVIFNEDKVEYDDGKVEVQVATFVHELLHCLYFHPKLFDHFPDTRSGKPYMFEDDNEDFKLRGNNILNQVRSHFDCDEIDGGTLGNTINLTNSQIGIFERHRICFRAF